MSAWARDSLRLRLLAGTLAWVLLSVLLAGWGLRALLREHITQQLQQQLVVQLDALSGSIDSLPGGRVRVEHQPDARLRDAEFWPAAHVPVPKAHAPRLGRNQPQQGVDRGGLAHAVASEQCDHLPGSNVQVHPEQHLAAPVGRLQSAQFKHVCYLRKRSPRTSCPKRL